MISNQQSVRETIVSSLIIGFLSFFLVVFSQVSAAEALQDDEDLQNPALFPSTSARLKNTGTTGTVTNTDGTALTGATSRFIWQQW